MQFSDTTNLQGLMQSYEAKTNLGYGTVSGDSTNVLKREFARYANIANRVILSWMQDSSGSWMHDDNNYTDLPNSTDDLVLGQRNYAIPADALTLKRVQIKNSSGAWYDVYATLQDVRDVGALVNGNPTSYFLEGNTLKFNVPLAYNSTDGLKFYFDRDVSDFAYDDTTKAPGFATQFHDAVAVGAAVQWFENTKPSDPTLANLRVEWADFEKRIRKFYDKRHKSYVPKVKRKSEVWS